MIQNIITERIEIYLSESEQYSRATIELEQFLDSVLYDAKSDARFTRFIISEGIFLKILVGSDYFTRSVQVISMDTKIRVGFYRGITVFVNIMQEDHIVIFKNSKKRIRDNKIDQIVSGKFPLSPVYTLDLRKLFQSSIDETSPQDTNE